MDFAERDQCKPVLLRLSLALNLKKPRSSETLTGFKSKKTTYVPLWDRMEGAWLWTLGSSNVTNLGSEKNIYLSLQKDDFPRHRCKTFFDAAFL